VAAVASALTYPEYLTRFNKTRIAGTADYLVHEAVFLSNLLEIEVHNLQELAWKMSVNQFTDMTPEEFKRFKGFRKEHSYLKRSAMSFPSNIPLMNDLPTSVDWRTKNVVTPVKNQGGCGSCWAFSATESLESTVALATGQLLTLSAQQIVSCTQNPDQCGGTGGCGGATPELAFGYVQGAGITSETNFPYEGITGTCPTSLPTVVAGIKSFKALATNSYEDLINAVATTGPISISVDASSWGMYGGGIFDGCDQTNPDLDHAVQLVGYGTEGGQDYWLVRNSWGESWGESGYIRLKRDQANPRCGWDTRPGDGSGCKGGPDKVKVCGTCGILYDNSYPTGGFIPKTN